MVSDKWWIVETFLDDDFTTQETGPLTALDSTVNLLTSFHPSNMTRCSNLNLNFTFMDINLKVWDSFKFWENLDIVFKLSPQPALGCFVFCNEFLNFKQ